MIKDSLKAPISLNIYNDFIYWFDVQDKVIRRVNKHITSTADEAIIQSDINDIKNLLVFHPSRQNPRGQCYRFFFDVLSEIFSNFKFLNTSKHNL